MVRVLKNLLGGLGVLRLVHKRPGKMGYPTAARKLGKLVGVELGVRGGGDAGKFGDKGRKVRAHKPDLYDVGYSLPPHGPLYFREYRLTILVVEKPGRDGKFFQDAVVKEDAPE